MNVMISELQDLSQILELQYLAYQSEAKLLNNFNIPPLTQTLSDLQREYVTGTILKAVSNDHLIIGSVRAATVNQTTYIGKLIVHPTKQKRGIGTALLQKIEQVCPARRYELFTSMKSQHNIRLYERCGYQIFMEKAVSTALRLIYLEKIVG